MAESTAVDLNGKVITVFLHVGSVLFPDQPGWTLESPRFEEQQGRLFLIGAAVAANEEAGAWYQNTTVNLSWDAVTHYLVYDSVNAYREAMSRAQVPKPKARWFGRRGAGI